MKQRVTALFVAAAFMTFAGVAGADAQQRRSSFDDWLGFDQSDDNWDQSARDRTFARDVDTQPDRGFPTLAKENIATTKTAIKQYAELVAQGGWPQLAPIELRTGVNHPAVVQLRRRLQATGDLQAYGGYPEVYDSYVEQAVKRAQLRHGIPPTGFLDSITIDALNVPASARLRQLRTNLTRLQNLVPSTPAGKYVLVNIPAAQIEAVNNNQVVSRHTGVVGKPDRPSPLLQSAIEEINFNKEWVVPPTVLKADLVPKGRSGQDVLAKYKIDAYLDHAAYQKGQRLDPTKSTGHRTPRFVISTCRMRAKIIRSATPKSILRARTASICTIRQDRAFSRKASGRKALAACECRTSTSLLHGF